MPRGAARPLAGTARAARSAGLARISASAGRLPRRAWHQSAATSAPVACALTTTVSIPSASRTCCAAVSRQAKYAPSSVALSWTAWPVSTRPLSASLRRSAT